VSYRRTVLSGCFLTTPLFSFFFYRSAALRDLPSFPTRRSSDLQGAHRGPDPLQGRRGVNHLTAEAGWEPPRFSSARRVLWPAVPRRSWACCPRRATGTSAAA